MRDYWWMGDWRNNPLIQRSRNPLLKQLALDTLRPYVERGQSMEYMLEHNCGIMGQHNRIGDIHTKTAVGHYLIPGSKTDNGVRCSSRQIGTILEYPDGKVEWDVFKLTDIFSELQQGEKPRQLELFSI